MGGKNLCTLLFLQGCEAKLEQMLQDVLSYAMLVILGFAIIKVHQLILASSSSLFIRQWIFSNLFCVFFSCLGCSASVWLPAEARRMTISLCTHDSKISWIPLMGQSLHSRYCAAKHSLTGTINNSGLKVWQYSKHLV